MLKLKSTVKTHILIFFLISSFFASVHGADRTEGVIINDLTGFEGYTLFAPMASEITYLIDNYGRVVHTWESQYRPNLSVYLLENGNLVRTYYDESEDVDGVQIFTWDGDLIWDFPYNDTFYSVHHDVEPLPNGNILFIVRDIRPRTELEDAGRDPASISTARIWLEKIVEVEPTGLNTGNIVWEWEIYDHLIQDFDSAKNNYGMVNAHPELMDVNYTPTVLREWLHANAIDYNSDLDQIIINLRNICEFWVIDHSTTTTEASGHTGGNSGKGGDILYRWGNSNTYKTSNDNEQKFFDQHDARWVETGLPGEGNITVFNNGVLRPEGTYSTVDEIVVPVDTYGKYSLPQSGNSFGPTSQSWIYEAPIPETMYSSNISGAHRLPNGNTLICVGARSRFIEVQSDGKTVWEYIYPELSSIFRCHRYDLDYEAFEGREIIPAGYIESYPITAEGTRHSPSKPLDIEEITITSKIYDTSGIQSVELNVFYGTESLVIEMNDSGIGADIVQGDSVYTANIPALPGFNAADYYIKIIGGDGGNFTDPPYASQDYYFTYDILSSTPENITIAKSESTLNIHWDPIENINEYKVYSSDDPYSGFTEDYSGMFDGETWTVSYSSRKKFYYVVAVKN
ncbi:MAG: aryl-sulfate sulfotransferase [Candidatus Delongbacteria bacterium]|jgi:hypothetical protein|nr:aryl-sulfate sulfotransferase [Candidatus Delongbacteria bacterium]